MPRTFTHPSRAGRQLRRTGRDEPRLETGRTRLRARPVRTARQLSHRAAPGGGPSTRDDARSERADESAAGRRRRAGPARDRHRPGEAARREPLPDRADVRVGPALRPRRLRSAGRRPNDRPVTGDRQWPTTVSTLSRSGRGLLLELGGPHRTRRRRPTVSTGVVAWVVDSPVGTELGASPGADRVLVRPDGHVCWAGAGSSSSPELALRRWFGTAPVRSA
jgi:aromatic ring hydroxylase-like protein